MDKIKVHSLLLKCTANINFTTADTAGLIGIYYSEGKAIASNSHVLFIVQYDYDPSYEGCVIDRKGNEVCKPYPNYKRVIPPAEATRECTDPTILNNLYRAARNLRHSEIGYHQACLRIENMCFHPLYILDVLQMFKLLKEPFKLFLSPGLPAVFNSPSCTALVMPLANCEEFNKVTVADAANFGDLL